MPIKVATVTVRCKACDTIFTVEYEQVAQEPAGVDVQCPYAGCREGNSVHAEVAEGRHWGVYRGQPRS